ncbi:hypothetical protein [Streptomyces sp. NPDC000878]
MSDHELQLLSIGFTVGAYFMLLTQVAFRMLDDRRDRKALRAAEALPEAARQRADA